MKSRQRGWRLPLALLAFAGSLSGLGVFVGSAHAIIGRPLTPFSVAGVARRTTRRAVYGGAAYGAYGYGAYGYPAVAPPVAAPPPAYYW